MKKKFIPFALLLFTSIFQISISQSAWSSTDDKLYPGLGCTPTAADYKMKIYRERGRIWNIDNKDHTYHCPIVRDRATNKKVGGHVVVYDRSSSGDVSCTLRVFTAVGGYIKTTTRKSSGFSDGYKVINIDYFDDGVNTNGYYNLDCKVPRAENGWSSGVASYNIGENY